MSGVDKVVKMFSTFTYFYSWPNPIKLHPHITDEAHCTKHISTYIWLSMDWRCLDLTTKQVRCTLCNYWLFFIIIDNLDDLILNLLLINPSENKTSHVHHRLPWHKVTSSNPLFRPTQISNPNIFNYSVCYFKKGKQLKSLQLRSQKQKIIFAWKKKTLNVLLIFLNISHSFPALTESRFSLTVRHAAWFEGIERYVPVIIFVFTDI